MNDTERDYYHVTWFERGGHHALLHGTPTLESAVAVADAIAKDGLLATIHCVRNDGAGWRLVEVLLVEEGMTGQDKGANSASDELRQRVKQKIAEGLIDLKVFLKSKDEWATEEVCEELNRLMSAVDNGECAPLDMGDLDWSEAIRATSRSADKGAGGTHIIDVDVSDLTQPLADENARLREELEGVKEGARKHYEHAMEYRRELVDMCLQFAGRTDDGFLWTMGMSDLESAFRVLGWPQPFCPQEKAT